jgi:hypothetical protein
LYHPSSPVLQSKSASGLHARVARRQVAIPAAASVAPGITQAIAALDEVLINWLPAGNSGENRPAFTVGKRTPSVSSRRTQVVPALSGTLARAILETRLVDTSAERASNVRPFLSVGR